MNAIDQKLQELGIEIPSPSAPVANYVSYVKTGNLVFIAGQISMDETGKIHTGRLGHGLTVEQGQAAARLCGLRIISQIKEACDGDLTRLVRIVKLGGFVASTSENSGSDIPSIINGCSDLLVDVFGDRGKHARFAVSTPALPRDCAVEIDAIVELN